MSNAKDAPVKISPLAGKPATLEMLVDVPRLVTAYYTDVPDPSVPEQRVAFGTSGIAAPPLKTLSTNGMFWRSVRRFAITASGRASAARCSSASTRTRCLCRLAASALEVLAANGVEVMLADKDEYTPTPVISHAILTYNRGRETGLADGIVITPSHNPPDNGGFKYNPPNGGPADTNITGWIEARANALSGKRPPGREENSVRKGPARRYHAPA